MRKYTLRVLLGAGYAGALTLLLLYQAGAFGESREWVEVLGTLILGVLLAVVSVLYVRANDRVVESEDNPGVDETGQKAGTGIDGKTFPQSYEEIYAQFLAVMEGCGLSERELEVAWLLYRGYTNRQIGESLYIAETTVKKHVSHIYQKMDVCSRKEFRNKVQAGSLSG